MEEVTSFNFLSITLDNKLKIQCQIDELNNKLSRFCGMMYWLSKHLSLPTAKNLTFSRVHSCLTYSLVVRGRVALCSHSCDKAFKLQRRIINKFVCRFFIESESVFKSARVLNFTDIHKLAVSVYMYEILRSHMYHSLKNQLPAQWKRSCSRYPI